MIIADKELYRSLSTSMADVSQKVLSLHRHEEQPNRLMEACQYALGASGKMMRGIMLIQACRAVGGNPEDVLYAAAGTEYGHLASLVHDDLMDQDEMRRGKRAVWLEYTPDFAILTRDLL